MGSWRQYLAQIAGRHSPIISEVPLARERRAARPASRGEQQQGAHRSREIAWTLPVRRERMLDHRKRSRRESPPRPLASRRVDAVDVAGRPAAHGCGGGTGSTPVGRTSSTHDGLSSPVPSRKVTHR
jgi:hypothetical protein